MFLISNLLSWLKFIKPTLSKSIIRTWGRNPEESGGKYGILGSFALLQSQALGLEEDHTTSVSVPACAGLLVLLASILKYLKLYRNPKGRGPNQRASLHPDSTTYKKLGLYVLICKMRNCACMCIHVYIHTHNNICSTVRNQDVIIALFFLF